MVGGPLRWLDLALVVARLRTDAVRKSKREPTRRNTSVPGATPHNGTKTPSATPPLVTKSCAEQRLPIVAR